ncbi:MAG: twin-arginine translocase TatA/TatE family subunit [Kiritimatiellae bacterium]|nr:twin-arginine translocase TatA/TatE family subunit [Kiritimatiellia bacterium]
MLAFIFDSVGFGEWFVLLTVVLIFVGPKKLPSVAKTIGNYYAKFRRTAENFKRQIMEMETEVTKEADTMTDAFRVDGDESKADPAADPTDPLAEGNSEGEGEGENYDDGMYDYMHEDGYREDGDDFNPEGEEEGTPAADAPAPAPAPAPAVDAPAPAAPAAEPPAEPKE